MLRKLALFVIVGTLAMTAGCAHKLYVRGVQDPDSERVTSSTALHVMFNPDSDHAEADAVLGAKIEKVLTG